MFPSPAFPNPAFPNQAFPNQGHDANRDSVLPKQPSCGC